MGVFDSVYVTCCKCGDDVEFQSKAGECYLRTYRLEEVPPVVAADIIGNSKECRCGNVITIRGQVLLGAEQSQLGKPGEPK